MGRFLPRLWIGSSLLAVLLACGCQHMRCRCFKFKHHTTAASTCSDSPANANAKQGKIQDLPPSLTETDQNEQTAASERFGHDPNYHWLMGVLDYSRIQEAWLLRYVPFDEDDRYGGCVTLMGFAPSSSLKSGQWVRVEGALIDPESRQLRPAYQVRNLRVVSP